MKTNKCKICRRLGTKLFIKGERCLSPKCAVIRRPTPPGPKRKGRFKALSEYGKELQEKQKLRNWYCLKEGQFSKYVKDILDRRNKIEDASSALIEKLESRFDNVVFRLGFASSRIQARQFISHGHFLINNKPVDISSYQLKKGDKVSVNAVARKKKNIEKVVPLLKKYQPPVWLKLNPEKLEGEVVGIPNLIEVASPAEISTIFEFYSR